MAIYRQRGSRNYWVSIYMGPGVPRFRRSTGTDDFEQAAAIEAAFKLAKRGHVERDKIIESIDALMGFNDKRVGIPIDRIADTYRNLPDLRVSSAEIQTRCTHVDRMARWMRDEWPSIRMMHEIPRAAAIQYGDHLRSITPVGKTFNNVRANIVRVFNTLLVRGGCAENVWSFVETAATSNSISGRAFSDDEIDSILAACDYYGHQWRAITIVALYTGLRYGDVANLNAADIKHGCIHLKPAKTAKRGIRVVIPLHKKARAAIRQQGHDIGPLFPDHAYTDRKHRPLKGGYGKILARAKIEPKGAKISFHCLRHTFRTALSKAHVSQELAMKLGGWTEESTAEIYNHDFSQMRAAINSLK